MERLLRMVRATQWTVFAFPITRRTHTFAIHDSCLRCGILIFTLWWLSVALGSLTMTRHTSSPREPFDHDIAFPLSYGGGRARAGLPRV